MSDRPPFPTSLCHRCSKHRLTTTDRGATFIRCTEPTLPRYRTQPIHTCPAFAPDPGPGAS